METQISQKDKDKIEAGIRSKYIKVAENPEGLFKYPTGRAGLDALGYDSGLIRALPEAVTASYCGAGNPFSLGHINEGEAVLDIGCGWGAFAIYAAEKYGVEVTGITVSREQVKLSHRCCEGLPVCIELQDYRDVQGTFDRIVSIGMFEHVGVTSYRTYMQVINRCLKDGGLFLLHTIGNNTSVHSVDPWLAKYIFPNSMLPSARQITEAAESIFILNDWHSFGPHYDPTLIAWHRNFIDNWRYIQDAYNQRFQRMWVYYLLSCAGSFRARRNQLWQIVFSKNDGSGNTRQALNHISPIHHIR